MQGLHSLSARWFVAGRLEQTSSPVSDTKIFFASQPEFSAGELTLGYRVVPDFTVRGAWTTSRFYGATAWHQQAAFSVVWARRWR